MPDTPKPESAEKTPAAALRKPRPSFSPARRWSIGFNVVAILLLVFAVVVMVNYLSREYYTRLHVSSRTRVELSLRTVKLLESITNRVRVTIYYDRSMPLYSTIADLLDEYTRVNPLVQVRTVDYLRDAAAALQLKNEYPFLNSSSAKDLVIFDSSHRVKPVDGSTLSQYVLEQVPNPNEQEFRRKPTAFVGEMMFTSALLDVTNPKALKAYFLTGHGEHQVQSADKVMGYVKFASVLQQNNIQVENISLLGTNEVPMDCNLLVVAGPTKPIPQFELDKIDQYLREGGRLLALLSFLSANEPTGLETVLRKWGVDASTTIVKDPENTQTGSDVILGEFGKHPTVNPLLGSRLHMMLPRAVSAASVAGPGEPPKVQELFFSGPKAVAARNGPPDPKQYSLGVAVEKGDPKNVITERGTTRLVVIGDSVFLGNQQIDSASNRDFASFVANWLLDRTQLLEGVGPKPITEYKLVMSQAQLRKAQWILLAGMPGVVLTIGSLVYFRRRR